MTEELDKLISELSEDELEILESNRKAMPNYDQWLEDKLINNN